MALRLMALSALIGAAAFGQGRCRDGYGTADCPLTREIATAPIKPVFAPTGWKTIALERITFAVPDYRREAAFYIALMGWKLRYDDGNEAVLDIGGWGSAVFRHARTRMAKVESICWVIEPWNAEAVRAELLMRGLTPVPDNDRKGFESFHLKDPDGFDLQISNSNGLARARPTANHSSPVALALPFTPTGWSTVWLDHLSYRATDYKETASFYTNLLGWRETYDEGSQHELMIGEVGDIIIRGGNRNNPAYASLPSTDRVDHISFGIAPWDTDRVRAELQKRGLSAEVDTSTKDDIHVAAFKSYHTTTPNGFNLQISYVTHDNRLALANAVKPK